jgi:NAD(P)-dependent dehydrogenase (short-subunit alcohol dehydrogenase family)
MTDNLKSVIITGGAQGIGSVMTRLFSSNGYTVFCIDKNKTAMDAFISEYGNDSIIPAECDIANIPSLKKTINSIADDFGGINCLINNACTNANMKLSEMSEDIWNNIISVNLSAPLFAVKFCEPYLRLSKGSVINIASTRALMSEPDTEAYSASKGGLLSLTHALAMSLAPDVRVNAISPGWIEASHLKEPSVRQTAEISKEDHLQHPAGRVGIPEDIAEMALYLCSDKAGFITGQNFIIDGGMTKKMIYV